MKNGIYYFQLSVSYFCRYGREEMLALFDKNAKPPASLTNFKSLYSETTLLPLALLPSPEEEVRDSNLNL